MQKERTFPQKITLFIKGLAMGAANKVPGVSGGTVSFVLGFYEELIYSFQKINLKAFKLLINGKFKSFFQYTNAPFLLLVMGGSMFSYFSVSLILDYFLKNYELYVWSWFFGMIIGSIYYMGKDFGKWSRKNFFSLVFGASIGLGISFLTPALENDNLWFVFICGIIGVSGMTLPGLSGSFILILLASCDNQEPSVLISQDENDGQKLTIFFTNDMHGQLNNFAKIKHIVDAERAETNVLLVSGGDIFSGSPIVDQYAEKGYPIIDIMNQTGYDATVIGGDAVP